ncbi:MAG: hypothetical protein FWH28_06750, partial [Clostridiales bacterium]|nr:hypothetical protein [Clostridiales bacterium]
MKRKVFSTVVSSILLLTLFLSGLAPAALAAGSPTPVNGRTLSRERAGDSSAWIEIAQFEGYSLLLRQEPITASLTRYSATTDNRFYASSLARTAINNWYKNTLA